MSNLSLVFQLSQLFDYSFNYKLLTNDGKSINGRLDGLVPQVFFCQVDDGSVWCQSGVQKNPTIFSEERSHPGPSFTERIFSKNVN